MRVRPQLRLLPTILRLNYEGPVAVLGDVHGRLDHLDRLLAKLPDDVQIIVTGDLCDRGPHTREVLDLLIERGATGCLGNHEEWFLTWAKGLGFDLRAMAWGAEATLTSYNSIGRDVPEVSAEGGLVPRDHVEWLDSLGIAVDLTVAGDQYWVTHAGLPDPSYFEGVPSEEVIPYLVLHHRTLLLWNFRLPLEMPSVDRPVIMGHVGVKEASDFGHIIALDTGCGSRPKGYLSALLLPDRKFIDSR